MASQLWTPAQPFPAIAAADFPSSIAGLSFGVLSFVSSSGRNFLYRGQFDKAKGRPEGLGILDYGEGRKFLGQWANGCWDGRGCLVYRSQLGDLVFFQGNFRRQRIAEGPGELLFFHRGLSESLIAKGEFDDDFLLSGPGSWVYSDSGDFYYRGNFSSGWPHGDGEEFFDRQTGNRYKGKFNRGNFHGIGEMIYYTTGARWFGEWADDEKAGAGLSFSPGESTIIKGLWSGNHMKTRVLDFEDEKTGENKEIFLPVAAALFYCQEAGICTAALAGHADLPQEMYDCRTCARHFGMASYEICQSCGCSTEGLKIPRTPGFSCFSHSGHDLQPLGRVSYGICECGNFARCKRNNRALMRKLVEKVQKTPEDAEEIREKLKNLEKAEKGKEKKKQREENNAARSFIWNSPVSITSPELRESPRLAFSFDFLSSDFALLPPSEWPAEEWTNFLTMAGITEAQRKEITAFQPARLAEILDGLLAGENRSTTELAAILNCWRKFRDRRQEETKSIEE